MIGVIATRADQAAVPEFFELFKTPWEWFNPKRSYEVVLTASDAPADVDATLLLIYSSSLTQWESNARITSYHKITNTSIHIGDLHLPIYGDVCTLSTSSGNAATLSDHSRAVAVEFNVGRKKVVHVGYDLFQEVAFLLSRGQPCANATFPTLDYHIAALRRLILAAGIPLIEIPPTPAGTRFISCLTHDIDFVSLKHHRFDHTMWGFLYRATCGALKDYLTGRISAGRLGANWFAAARLPLVHLGLCADFWLPFRRYLDIDGGKASTFFVIPFKHQAGTSPYGAAPKRRASRYDVDDVRDWIQMLCCSGHEVGVHAIEAWHDSFKGKQELDRVTGLTGAGSVGVRTHWLYSSARSPELLEAAGFAYDSTCGFNEAVGFRAGTSQVFRPFGVQALLELPLHIQDTAMFYPGRMHLSEPAAWSLCVRLLQHCSDHGGVLTVLWHDRSLVPDRCWHRFYADLLKEMELRRSWFATAGQVVLWFRKRREIAFREIRQTLGRMEIHLDNVPTASRYDLVLRLYTPTSGRMLTYRELPLQGRVCFTFEMPDALMHAQSDSQAH